LIGRELPYGEDSPLAMAVQKSREPPLAPESLSPALRSTWSAAILKCMAADAQRRGDGGGGGHCGVGPLVVASRTRRASRCGLARGRLRSAGWRTGRGGREGDRPASAASRGARVSRVAVARIGFAAKAEAEFSTSCRKPLQSEADRLFEQAAAAELRTTGAGARDPGTQRKRRYGIGRLGVHRRPTRPPHGGDEWKRVAARFRIIRPRICGGPKRRRSKANGSRLSGSSSWRKRISMRLATPTWCALCPRAAASRAWKAATWIKPAPTCPRSSACNLACRIPAMGLATEPSR